MQPIKPKRQGTLVLAVFLTGAIGIALAKNNEKEIAAEDLPAKALNALSLLKDNSKFEEIESEKENGVQLYEAEWESDGREHSATVDAEGTLIERENSVNDDEIPKAVADAIAKHLPKGGEREIDLQMTVTYEASVEIDGKKFEITVTPDGKVVEKDEDEKED